MTAPLHGGPAEVLGRFLGVLTHARTTAARLGMTVAERLYELAEDLEERAAGLEGGPVATDLDERLPLVVAEVLEDERRERAALDMYRQRFGLLRCELDRAGRPELVARPLVEHAREVVDELLRARGAVVQAERDADELARLREQSAELLELRARWERGQGVWGKVLEQFRRAYPDAFEVLNTAGRAADELVERRELVEKLRRREAETLSALDFEERRLKVVRAGLESSGVPVEDGGVRLPLEVYACKVAGVAAGNLSGREQRLTDELEATRGALEASEKDAAERGDALEEALRDLGDVALEVNKLAAAFEVPAEGAAVDVLAAVRERLAELEGLGAQLDALLDVLPLGTLAVVRARIVELMRQAEAAPASVDESHASARVLDEVAPTEPPPAVEEPSPDTQRSERGPGYAAQAKACVEGVRRIARLPLAPAEAAVRATAEAVAAAEGVAPAPAFELGAVLEVELPPGADLAAATDAALARFVAGQAARRTCGECRAWPAAGGSSNERRWCMVWNGDRWRLGDGCERWEKPNGSPFVELDPPPAGSPAAALVAEKRCGRCRRWRRQLGGWCVAAGIRRGEFTAAPECFDPLPKCGTCRHHSTNHAAPPLGVCFAFAVERDGSAGPLEVDCYAPADAEQASGSPGQGTDEQAGQVSREASSEGAGASKGGGGGVSDGKVSGISENRPIVAKGGHEHANAARSGKDAESTRLRGEVCKDSAMGVYSAEPGRVAPGDGCPATDEEVKP